MVHDVFSMQPLHATVAMNAGCGNGKNLPKKFVQASPLWQVPRRLFPFFFFVYTFEARDRVTVNASRSTSSTVPRTVCSWQSRLRCKYSSGFMAHMLQGGNSFRIIGGLVDSLPNDASRAAEIADKGKHRIVSSHLFLECLNHLLHMFAMARLSLALGSVDMSQYNCNVVVKRTLLSRTLLSRTLLSNNASPSPAPAEPAHTATFTPQQNQPPKP